MSRLPLDSASEREQLECCEIAGGDHLQDSQEHQFKKLHRPLLLPQLDPSIELAGRPFGMIPFLGLRLLLIWLLLMGRRDLPLQSLRAGRYGFLTRSSCRGRHWRDRLPERLMGW